MASKKKPKFYVVWQGHQPGVYQSWSDCQKQVAGFPGAKFKSFASAARAKAAFDEPWEMHWSAAGKSTDISRRSASNSLTVDELKELGVDVKAIAVDAACKGNPGPLEYQGVEIESNVNLFHQGPFRDGTVNIGEFLAIVHALALLHHGDNGHITIYSDSLTGIAWVRERKCKTKLKQRVDNRRLFQLVARAEKWLRENEFSNPILKWETSRWGEIPADFGRK